MIFKKLDKFRDLGILILRMGVGFMFVMHGYPKLVAGLTKWEALGQNMSHLGIDFGYTFWGFMGMAAEFFGGILLMLGMFTRLTVLLMAFTMLVAMLAHLGRGDDIMGASHAIELGIVFLSLFFIGPGKYSMDKMFL